MAKTKNNCPICNNQHYDTDNTDFCSKHCIGWFATICRDCKRACYSQLPGLCTNCLEKSPKMERGAGGGKDRRTILRKYGQEGDDYFGNHEK